MSKIPFDRVLEALKDNSTAFPARYLPLFSDLTPKDLQALDQVWPELPLDRKRRLMRSLNDLREEDTRVSFDALAEKMLKDADDQVRLYAVRMLWDASAEPRLTHRFISMMQSDPSPDVRAEAASVLGVYVYDGEVEELSATLLKDVEEALLAETRREGMDDVKRRAMESLGYSSRPEVPALLEASMRLRDERWVASALFAMGRSSDNKKWGPVIMEHLDSSSDPVRLAAVGAAGELSLAAAREPLLAALDEEQNDEVLRAVIWSLSQIGGEDVRVYLENLLDAASDDDIADYIAEAIENLTFTEDMQKFELLSLDPEDDFE